LPVPTFFSLTPPPLFSPSPVSPTAHAICIPRFFDIRSNGFFLFFFLAPFFLSPLGWLSERTFFSRGAYVLLNYLTCLFPSHFFPFAVNNRDPYASGQTSPEPPPLTPSVSPFAPLHARKRLGFAFPPFPPTTPSVLRVIRSLFFLCYPPKVLQALACYFSHSSCAPPPCSF